ncbi:hypothetical protein POM88_044610 [Heracleum sosnowskyi]|uniref:Uncharacterized protein n=1 Tax=Heracleum sosnowskyi TaxID=360622 RepID=A0AAD8M448_9APIA|nr:hypothetical protein POM88_044610 [Heracleum sosnowskyi]
MAGSSQQDIVARIAARSLGREGGVPRIFDFLSCLESIPNWIRNFIIVRWRGGDWDRFFRPQFCQVSDPGKFDKKLFPSELLQLKELGTDEGRTHYKTIIKESNLRAVGLSSVSEEAEWSKHGIPPADQVNIVHREEFLDETELQGAHAAYAVNAYFQSAIHQAKVLRDSEWATKKENKRLSKEVKVDEARMLPSNKQL